VVNATDVTSCGDLSVALTARVVSKPNLISDEVTSPRVTTGSERKEVSFLACACNFSREFVDESICVVVSSCSCSSEHCLGISREKTDGSVDVSIVAVVPVWIQSAVEFAEVVLEFDERIEVLEDCAEDSAITKDCLVVEACAAIESGELARGKSAIEDNGDGADVRQFTASSPGLLWKSTRGFEPRSTDIKSERSGH
jgi:hypothetical protein